MRKKENKSEAEKLVECRAQMPDWYWKRGLHDAVIRSVSECKLVPNYKEKKPKYNCLEIELDSKNALYERNIKTIRLYNYKIKTPDLDIHSFDEPWWMWDTMKELDNQRYLLNIEIEPESGPRKIFSVEFEIPEIERE